MNELRRKTEIRVRNKDIMDTSNPSNAVPIDLSTWERKALFESFRDFSEPFHGVCLRIDCTETFRFAKSSGVSVFLTLVHRSLAAAHRVENFKTRILGEQVWLYDEIHGGSAVGRENGTIGFGTYRYHPHILPFVREASLEVESVKNRRDLERYSGQDLIRFSVLPWFDFTSISHARNLLVPDSAPRITFGKISESNGRYTMPISIHVHHALADGSHVGLFVEQLEQCLAAPTLVSVTS